MKSLLLAAALTLAATAPSAGKTAGAMLIQKPMTAEEAYEIIDGDSLHCYLGKQYDGGPDISEEEVAAACARVEAAKNRLVELGIKE